MNVVLMTYQGRFHIIYCFNYKNEENKNVF